MSGFGGPWCLCGGWAVDAWLGRQTRDHGDLDVTVFEDQRVDIFRHLAGWQLVPHDAVAEDTNSQWDGRALELPAHLHCRGPEDSAEIPESGALMADQGWWLEVMFNQRTAAHWVFSGDPFIAMPMESCVRKSPWGVPALIPDALLFYKATAYKGTRHYLRQRDHEDFERLLPVIRRESKDWLARSIALVDADHPWLGVLSL
jgi:hypothetical protein